MGRALPSPVLSTEWRIWDIAKIPIIMTTRSTPEVSFRIPKVMRGVVKP